MALTDAWLRKAKPGDKVYKKSDAAGLYIEVTTAGNKKFGVMPIVTMANRKRCR